jgi:hypothetical protein
MAHCPECQTSHTLEALVLALTNPGSWLGMVVNEFERSSPKVPFSPHQQSDARNRSSQARMPNLLQTPDLVPLLAATQSTSYPPTPWPTVVREPAAELWFYHPLPRHTHM